MQAYIICLIRKKILQPTICSLSWMHTTCITDVSFKSTGYLLLWSLVIVCDCLLFVKVNLCSWFLFAEKSGPLCVTRVLTPVQVSRQVMVPWKCRV